MCTSADGRTPSGAVVYLCERNDISDMLTGEKTRRTEAGRGRESRAGRERSRPFPRRHLRRTSWRSAPETRKGRVLARASSARTAPTKWPTRGAARRTTGLGRARMYTPENAWASAGSPRGDELTFHARNDTSPTEVKWQLIRATNVRVGGSVALGVFAKCHFYC